MTDWRIDVPKIREMAAKGMTASEIAKAMGRTPSGVKYAADKNSIELAICTDAKRRLYRDYAARGFTVKQVMKATGRTKKTVTLAAARYGAVFQARPLFTQANRNAT